MKELQYEQTIDGPFAPSLLSECLEYAEGKWVLRNLEAERNEVMSEEHSASPAEDCWCP